MALHTAFLLSKNGMHGKVDDLKCHMDGEADSHQKVASKVMQTLLTNHINPTSWVQLKDLL